MLTLICACLSTGSSWSFKNQGLKQLSVPAGEEQQFFKGICDSERDFVLQYKQENTAMACWNCCCPTCFHTTLVTAHKANFCAILWKFPFCYCYKILLNLPNFQQAHNTLKKGTQAKSLLFIALNIFLCHHNLENQHEISDALLSISIQCKNLHCPKFLQLLIPFISVLFLRLNWYLLIM